MSETDKQYEGRLIDEYEYLISLREIAVEEKAGKTVKAIDKKIDFIKLKLQPMELPNDPTKKD